jgi:hypothetical protein
MNKQVTKIRPSSASEFNQMFIESVKETIAGLLGRKVFDAFASHLQSHIGLPLEEISIQPDLLFKALRDAFGMAGDRVGRYFVKNLYLKAGLQFVEHDGGTLVDYVAALKQRLIETEFGRSS